MTDLATRPQNSHAPARREPTLRDLVESPNFKARVAQVLPKHLTPDRFVRIAILAMTRTPKLADCSPESVLMSLMTLSQYGLEPDGRRAHLIPFKRNFKVNDKWQSVMECQLIIDYKGLAELVMRSGLVSFIHADVICDKDDFDFDAGELKHHRVDYRHPRGPMYAAYTRIRFKDGSEKCEVMSLDEINAIRKRSKSGDNGPWVTDFQEMAKKTVFRRASKWLSLSPEFRDAVEHEDEREPIDVTAEESTAVSSRLESIARQRAELEAAPEVSGDDAMDGIEGDGHVNGGNGAATTGPASSHQAAKTTTQPPVSRRPGPKVEKPAEEAPAPTQAAQDEPGEDEQRLIRAEEWVDAISPEQAVEFVNSLPADVLARAKDIAGTNLDAKAPASEWRTVAINAKAALLAEPPAGEQSEDDLMKLTANKATDLAVSKGAKAVEKELQRFAPSVLEAAKTAAGFTGSVSGRKVEELSAVLYGAKLIELAARK